MPCNLFWAMNVQIDRIQAEQDLRLITANQCTMNGEIAKDTIYRLQEKHSSIYRYGGDWIVEPESGAKGKLLSLMG